MFSKFIPKNVYGTWIYKRMEHYISEGSSILYCEDENWDARLWPKVTLGSRCQGVHCNEVILTVWFCQYLKCILISSLFLLIVIPLLSLSLFQNGLSFSRLPPPSSFLFIFLWRYRSFSSLFSYMPLLLSPFPPFFLPHPSFCPFSLIPPSPTTIRQILHRRPTSAPSSQRLVKHF